MRLGAQMYTVREFTQTEDALAQTLAKIAEIGYTAVQVSGSCAYDAGWMDEQLKKNGLVCPVTHTSQDRIAGETVSVAEEHKRFGCGVVGIGSAPGEFANGFSDYEAFRDRFLPAARLLKENGRKMGYHNHQFEFNKHEGRTLLEYMAEDFSPEELCFILDTYWVQFAGGDPAAWIRRLSGRVECVHLKDMSIKGKEQKMAVVGEGNINFESVLNACEAAGTKFLFVEQDDCNGEDPFNCLARSYSNLKTMGYD